MENLQVEKSVSVLDPTRNRVLFSLAMRPLLFAGFGGMMVGVFAIVGNESPVTGSRKVVAVSSVISKHCYIFYLKAVFLEKKELNIQLFLPILIKERR